MKKILLGLVLLGLLSSVTAASAALIDSAVPDNAYISIGNYDVAWISPVDEGYYVDMSYQSQFGWQIMTRDIFDLLGIDAYDFVVDGGNVDYATGNNYDEISGARLAHDIYTVGGDLAIAVPYFSNVYRHADWGNGVDGLWNFTGDSFILETLAFRETAPVPEPSTFLLFGGGLLGLGYLGRKRMKS